MCLYLKQTNRCFIGDQNCHLLFAREKKKKTKLDTFKGSHTVCLKVIVKCYLQRLVELQ